MMSMRVICTVTTIAINAKNFHESSGNSIFMEIFIRNGMRYTRAMVPRGNEENNSKISIPIQSNVTGTGDSVANKIDIPAGAKKSDAVVYLNV